MMKSGSLQQAVRYALAMAAGCAAIPAVDAQTAPAQAEAAAAPLAEVVVTGSRLQTPNETAISPITTVSAADIQATGLTRVEDVLNNLPMVFAGMNSTVSNGSDGTATVDLRGLGAQRTLVLVNGRRLGPGGDVGLNTSDINQIPTALIERVDVLTGGASSVYGADAVAGVVNFILNTHFEGVKIDATYDFYQHNNNDNGIQSVLAAAGDAVPPGNVNTGFDKTISIIMGSNFADNKGNATAYLTYDNQAAVTEGQYDYAACTLANANPAPPPAPFTGYACGGSGTSAHGEFLGYGKGVNGPLFDNTVDPNTGIFRQFTAADLYNYGAINYYLRPNERWTAGTFVNYDINPNMTVYTDIMWMRNNSAAQIAASGSFFTPVFVPCADPLMTAQEMSVVCAPGNGTAQNGLGLQTSETVNGVNYPGATFYLGRRNVEGLPRTTLFTSDSIHLTTGVKGSLGDAWTYDVYAQRSTVDVDDDTINYLSTPGVTAAMNVITGPALLPNGLANPNAGKPECVAAYTGTIPGCVPWNVWKPGGVTQQQLASLYIPLEDQGNVVENVVSGSVTGDLGKYGVKLPTADDGMQFNVGAEYRSESSVVNTDLAEQDDIGEGVGGPAPPVAGSFHVSEAFTEMNLPLVQHAPFADSLAMDAGYRYSSYTTGFNTNTYKLGLEWAPVKDIRFRTSYNRAVRAPNISELYTPQATALDGTEDPCAGTTPAFSPTQCAHTGVSAAQYGHIGLNPAGQYNGLDGGNPTLKPEVADSYGVGFVLQPRVLPNLSVSVDYFDIKIKDVINDIGENTILNECGQTGNPLFCSLIHRQPGNGSLWLTPAGFVTDTLQNLGSLSTKGVDLKASYRQPLPALGSLLLSLEGTHLDSLATQPLPGGPSFDCVGLYGGTCGAPNSKWRHVFNGTWSTPWDALNVTLRWRYIGSGASQETSSNPQLAGIPPGVASVPAYNYLDMTADWALYKSIRMQIGVNNIFDKNPPLFNGTDCPVLSTGASDADCNGNTWAGTYDALGRYIFIHLSAQF